MPTTTDPTPSLPNEAVLNSAADMLEDLLDSIEEEDTPEDQSEVEILLEDAEMYRQYLDNLVEARAAVPSEAATAENFTALMDKLAKARETEPDSTKRDELLANIAILESARERIDMEDDAYDKVAKNYFLNLLGATATDDPHFEADFDRARSEFHAAAVQMENEVKAYNLLARSL